MRLKNLFPYHCPKDIFSGYTVIMVVLRRKYVNIHIYTYTNPEWWRLKMVQTWFRWLCVDFRRENFFLLCYRWTSKSPGWIAYTSTARKRQTCQNLCWNCYQKMLFSTTVQDIDLRRSKKNSNLKNRNKRSLVDFDALSCTGWLYSERILRGLEVHSCWRHLMVIEGLL